MYASWIVLPLLSAAALASPVPDTDAVAASSQWSLQGFTRTCNGPNTSCSFSYAISTGSGAATSCKYTITGSGVSTKSYNNIHCGAFTISSGWSGQFGPGNGFTTLAVTNNKQIIYPAYTDKQLVNGKKVTPDQAYNPQNV